MRAAAPFAWLKTAFEVGTTAHQADEARQETGHDALGAPKADEVEFHPRDATRSGCGFTRPGPKIVARKIQLFIGPDEPFERRPPVPLILA